MPTQKTDRLSSLDILRGLDLFLLLFVQPVLWAVCDAVGSPAAEAVRYHFDHEVWEGFRFWDLIMPLFLFMTGAAMPFSFAKFLNGKAPRGRLYLKILRRFIILFALGMVMQGNVLALDPEHIYVYTNTLQAIATGYLIASLIILNLRPRLQISAVVVLIIIYALPMVITRDYSPQGNFAYTIDLLILGNLRGDITYTWIWSSLTFGVSVMFGAFAGQIICTSRPQIAKTRLLALVGAALTVAGLIASARGFPIIKRIWSASMTIFSGGLCFLLLAFFYWVVDCRKYCRGLSWLKIYGMNSITAYVAGEVINFRSIVASLTFGLEHWIGPQWYAALLTLGNALILFAILAILHRQKIYLKI